MLINFKVKNFRSIKDEVCLDLLATHDETMQLESVFEESENPLLKSIAIYGANASGKSNIFKAFAVFRMMILESLIRSNLANDLPNEYFKLSSETENKSSFFEMTFIINDEVYIYGFEINRKKVCKEWLRKEKGNVNLFCRDNLEIKSNKNYFKEASSILKKQTSERVLFLSVLASNNKPLSKKIVDFINKMNYISGAERGSTLDFSFNQFLNNPDMALKMKEFIVRADFGIVDIKASEKMTLAKDIQHIPDKFKELFLKEGSRIAERDLWFFHKKENGESVPFNFFNEESEGTQQMFALLAPIIDTLDNGKILFIDEIDASLHPTICQYIVSIFNSRQKNSKNAQLIFTTHDISLLKEEFLRRDQIYFTNKNDEGATKLFSLSDTSERKGVDFAKRYLEGRYDALPYIADFEDLKFFK